MFLYDTGGWPACLCITQQRGQYDCMECSWVACMFVYDKAGWPVPFVYGTVE